MLPGRRDHSIIVKGLRFNLYLQTQPRLLLLSIQGLSYLRASPPDKAFKVKSRVQTMALTVKKEVATECPVQNKTNQKRAAQYQSLQIWQNPFCVYKQCLFCNRKHYIKVQSKHRFSAYDFCNPKLLEKLTYSFCYNYELASVFGTNRHFWKLILAKC